MSEQTLCFIPKPGKAQPSTPTGKGWCSYQPLEQSHLSPSFLSGFSSLSTGVFPYVCYRVYTSVCLAALLLPPVYNISSGGPALTCGHSFIILYSNLPEVLRRDSQAWRFQMVWKHMWMLCVLQGSTCGFSRGAILSTFSPSIGPGRDLKLYMWIHCQATC